MAAVVPPRTFTASGLDTFDKAWFTMGCSPGPPAPMRAGDGLLHGFAGAKGRTDRCEAVRAVGVKH